MKTLIILLSFLMISPAMSFDQNDLDQINSFSELAEEPAFDFGDFSTEGAQEVEAFLDRRRFRCVARNGRGDRFRAQGRRPRQARRRAMRRCRNNSRRPRSCRIVRCNRRGGALNDIINIIDLID